MIKGKFSKNPKRNFADNLSKILELPDDLITDHYVFGKTIGLGQYGTVKEATHIDDHNQKVAVKILDLEGLAKTFKSICCEVSSLKQANHPNIIKLLKWFKDDTKLYLVFEYVPGMDLSDYITENIKISEEKSVYILQQIWSTINYLHSIHICHRDIKLDNIMINPDNLEIKLIDFGFATKFSEREKLKGKIGTPYYVAPEILKGTYGKECDMWSIGIMTYYMLVGDPPFNAESGRDQELFDIIITNPVPYQKEDWSDVSKDWFDFVQKLLEKNPYKRMTALEAIDHPWLEFKTSVNSDELGETLTNSN
jgi:calcium-dependent protein kinase